MTHIPAIASSRATFVAILTASTLLGSPPASASGIAADLTLSLGARLPFSEYGETQAGLSIDGSVGRSGWPLQAAVYVAAFMERHDAIVWPPEEDYVSGEHRTLTREIGLGVSKTLATATFNPYVAGGCAR